MYFTFEHFVYIRFESIEIIHFLAINFVDNLLKEKATAEYNAI